MSQSCSRILEEDSCLLAESLTVLSSDVLWKAEIINDKSWYITKEISKQYAEGATLFLLAFYSKMQEEREIDERIVTQNGISSVCFWKLSTILHG